MKISVNIREVNQHLTKYLNAVQSGNEVIITRRGIAIARLLPISKKKRLTVEQKTALKRSLALAKKGLHLGGKFNRDEAHER